MSIVIKIWLGMVIGFLGACSGSGGGNEATTTPQPSPNTPSPSAFVYTSYAPLANNGGLSGFRVAGDSGDLAPVPGSPFVISGNGVSLAANPKTNILYVLSGGSLDIFQRGADGGLQRLSAQTLISLVPNSTPVSSPINAVSLCVHPSGRWLYVVDDSPFDPDILVFPIVETGANAGRLGSSVQEFSAGGASGIRPSKCLISGNQLYVTFPFGGVSTLDIAGDGKLTFAQGNEILRPGGLNFAVKHPSTPIIYAGSSVSNGIDKLAINPNGSLTFIQRFDTGAFPTSIAIDPRGQLFYATNRESNSISAYRLTDNGDLAPLAPASFATDAAPNSATFDPSGNTLYVTHNPFGTPGNIRTFSVNGTSGELVSRSALEIIGSPTQVISVVP